jgi:hypothetical protein
MQIFVTGIFLFPTCFNILNIIIESFSLVYTVGSIVSPIIGATVDRVGYNIYWLLFGAIATMGTYCLVAFTYTSPFINMVTQSLNLFLL